MIGARHEKAYLQSDFYRDQYRKMLRWLIYTTVLIYFLIGGIFYFIFVQPAQSYYGNTSEGKILAMPIAERG